MQASDFRANELAAAIGRHAFNTSDTCLMGVKELLAGRLIQVHRTKHNIRRVSPMDARPRWVWCVPRPHATAC